MSLFLGNLQLKDVVKKQHLDEIKKFLDNNDFKRTSKCDDVENGLGNYHIYDIPRQLHICGEEKVLEFFNFLKKNDLLQKAFIGSLTLYSVAPKQVEKDTSQYT